MRIVVLDGYTLNPGDLNWDKIASLGDLQVYDRTPSDNVLDRSQGAEVLLTNKTVLSRETIKKLEDLRYIGVLATGTNVVDLEAAAERDIPVCNAAGYSTPAVAQMVFAYILQICNRVAEHSYGVHDGKWSRSEDFCYTDYPQIELAGQTIGIVGLGEIGSKVGEIARAFGMRVIAYTRSPDKPEPAGVSWVSMETLFRESDIVSLHCPLTSETENLINEKTIGIMKKGSILVNTGRGPLVDESALAAGLNSGHLAGAGIDVLKQEPPQYESPLIGAPNCYITPHIAWATRSSRERLMQITFENLKAYSEGRIQSRVN